MTIPFDPQALKVRADEILDAMPPDDRPVADRISEAVERARLADGEPHAESRRPPNQATKLIEITEDVEFFHDPHGTAYATYTVGDHRETEALRKRGFRSYLERSFYKLEGKPPSSQAVQDALGVMDGKARFDAGVERSVHVRVAGDDEAIYLDLGGPSWEAVVINSDGWTVISSPPVKFRRPKGMLALPHPEPGRDLDELRALVNVLDRDWPLFVAWAIAALRPAGPFPVLASYGEQGSAKSSTQRIVRNTIDPATAPLRAAPRNEHELMIAARNNWILGFDNTSVISPPLSDAFARIATGAGFSARQLYSDDEEMIFEETRPVLINGIEEVVIRPDLLDRALILEHPRIPDAQRRPERDVWRDFEAARPRILGALLGAAVVALRNLPTVDLAELPRMADFAQWLVAAESALGWEPGRFLDAYTGNRASAHAVAMDSSPIAGLIRNMAEAGFEGTASDLLAVLGELGEDGVTRQRAWPRSASALSGALRRLAPNMREIGIQIEFKRSGNRRTIAIRKSPENAVTSVTSVTPGTPELDFDDDGDDAPDVGAGAAVIELGTDDGDDGDDGDLHTQSPEGNGAIPLATPEEEEIAMRLGISLFDEEAA